MGGLAGGPRALEALLGEGQPLRWAKDSHSELQLRDVRNIQSSVADLDVDYVDRWAKGLGVWELRVEARS